MENSLNINYSIKRFFMASRVFLREIHDKAAFVSQLYLKNEIIYNMDKNQSMFYFTHILTWDLILFPVKSMGILLLASVED